MYQNLKKNIYLDYIFRFLANFNICDAIWVLYLGYKGLSLWQIGVIEGIFHVTSLLSEVPSGALADMLGRKRVLLAGRICGVISSLVMLFADRFCLFGVCCCGDIVHRYRSFYERTGAKRRGGKNKRPKAFRHNV
ncbi:MAG: MFS transporter [Bacillus sp. (in: Bacteria)]|nr:MFS transporter [Bacillus sp. (in: firmicutes)]MCM1427653.1 MFS transporter [Eubacterium sp.]